MFQKITGCGHHKALLICTYLRGMYRVYAVFPWSGYMRPRSNIKHRQPWPWSTRVLCCTRAFGFGGGAVRRMRRMDFLWNNCSPLYWGKGVTSLFLEVFIKWNVADERTADGSTLRYAFSMANSELRRSAQNQHTYLTKNSLPGKSALSLSLVQLCAVS